MRKWLFLGVIVAVFLFTRVYKITEIPGSVYWDEASIGYNAYSILQDGKDEWGNFLPLHFRAFGEFKLPVYIYSVALSETIFGLNAFSVRLPAVVYSTLSLIVLYLITKKVFSEKTAIFTSLVFTLSPWYFIFSRTGYEMTAGLFFFLLGVLLFLNIGKKGLIFIPMALSFLLSFYSYNSFRIIIPFALLIFGLIFLANKEIKLTRRIIIAAFSAIIFLSALIPVYKLYKYDAGSVRLTEVGATSAKQVIKNYFSHFSYSFLFSSGDQNPRSNMPGFGELFVTELPFLLLGIFVLAKKRVKFWWIVPVMILLGPIPAAITKESPHALRSILMFPFLTVLIGLGCDYVTSLIKREKIFIPVVLFLLFMFSFENYFTNFLTGYFNKYGSDWQYGYNQIFQNYAKDFNKYGKVIISDQYAQPYIFALYDLKEESNNFRSSVTYNSANNWGFSTVNSFGNFIFKKIQATDLKINTLVFATPGDKIYGILPSGEIKNLDGTTAFYIYKR